MQQPTPNLENAVWSRAIYRIAHSQGATVMLTGNFGNLTVSYAGMEYLGSLIRHWRIGKAFTLGRSLLANGAAKRTVLSHIVGPFLPTAVWAAAAKLHGWVLDLRKYTAVSPAVLGKIKAAAKACGYDLTYKPSKDPDQLRSDVLAEYDFGNYTKGVLAEWGISLRDPLTDRRVIEFCLATPVREFIRDGVPRSLARRAFADRLPKSVTNNSARGYQSPDWYIAIGHDRTTLRREVEAISHCAPAAAAMDLAWVQQAASSWPNGGWAKKDILMRYRYGMLRAVSIGHFMRKVAGTN